MLSRVEKVFPGWMQNQDVGRVLCTMIATFAPKDLLVLMWIP
jgi:hypothetical protein